MNRFGNLQWVWVDTFAYLVNVEVVAKAWRMQANDVVRCCICFLVVVFDEFGKLFERFFELFFRKVFAFKY